MQRRSFLSLLGTSAAAWPLVARAQQAAMPVVGYLRSGSRAAVASSEAAFHRGLISSGFVEGRSVAIAYRHAENQNDRLPSLVADLVRQQLSLIYAGDTPSAMTAKAATATIPIVFRIGGEPIQL